MTVRLGLTLVLLCDGIFTVTSSNPRNPVRYINTFWYFINSAVTDILWLTSSVGSCSLGKCKMWRERLCILSVCTHHWSNNYHFYYHDILESVTLQVIAFFTITFSFESFGHDFLYLYAIEIGEICAGFCRSIDWFPFDDKTDPLNAGVVLI